MAAEARASVRLGVRPLRIEDVPAVVRYWTGASRAELDRMGVDVTKLPSADELARSLSALCLVPVREARAAYLVWEVDGAPIGHAGLKNIRYGDSGDMHLHIWDSAARGRGYGARLFALSALEFYERFALTRIVCEPKADNPMPNRMLQKSGYALLGSRVGASSELSTVCRLNVYSIDRATAARIAAS
jgi:RimJ/RimL family protein N-acetyltransferase